MRKLLVVVGSVLLSLFLSQTSVLAQGIPPPSGSSVLDNCITFQQNVHRTLEATLQALRCIRDGSLIEIPWVQALALEGRTFCVNYGQNNTFVTGHVGGPTSGQPDANLDIPTGTAIIPLFAVVYNNTLPGTAPINYLNFNANLTGNGTSVAATAGPFNARLGDQPISSRTTARQAYSGTGTVPTTILEVNPLPTPAAAQTTVWNFLTQSPILPIVGPASMSYYTSATTTGTPFKMTFCWIELPASTVQ